MAAAVCVLAVPATAPAAPGLSCLTLLAGTAGIQVEALTSALPGTGLAAALPRAEGPERVDLRTTQAAFNRRYEFALWEGRLVFRPRGGGTWRAVPVPSCLQGRLREISADDDELAAVDAEGRIHILDGVLSDPLLWTWTSRWGRYFWTGLGHRLPAGTVACSATTSSGRAGRAPGSLRRRVGTQRERQGESVERTLILVKPDAFARRLTGEILARFERKGLTIAAMKLMTVDRELAEQHYAEHKEKPFFGELVEFITSGPLVALVLEGHEAVKAARQVIGSTNPVEAAPGSIRGDFGLQVQENLVHGSDSPESAQREIALWFPEL